jgi:hypothetical protein
MNATLGLRLLWAAMGGQILRQKYEAITAKALKVQALLGGVADFLERAEAVFSWEDRYCRSATPKPKAKGGPKFKASDSGKRTQTSRTSLKANRRETSCGAFDSTILNIPFKCTENVIVDLG